MVKGNVSNNKQHNPRKGELQSKKLSSKNPILKPCPLQGFPTRLAPVGAVDPQW